MAFHHSPRIITDGLVLSLDAADKNSYIGSGTTWSDLSPNGNDGTLSAAAIGTDVPGVMDFNGSSEYVTVGASNAIVTGTDVSYAVWVKSTDNDSAYLIQMQKGAGSSALTFQLNLSVAGQIGLVIWDGSTHNNVTYAAGLNDSTWHHIVATTTSSAQVLYLDGVAVATGTRTFVNAASSDLFQIGRIGSGSEYFGGSITGVNVYNRALSTKEVSQNFNAQRSRFGV
jgi:hypothetical protein